VKLLRDAEDIIKDAGGVPEEHQYDQRSELQVIVSSSVALQHEQNEQDKLDYTPELDKIVQTAVATTLDVIGGGDMDFEVSILITDNEGIHAINKEYREIDAPTDVLSFPILEFDEDGVMLEESGDYDGDFLLLGDIVISLERAKSQAEEYGHSLEREVGFLAVHSTLHLLGFDHMEEPYASVMRSREEEILNKMNLKRD
jgi:probable rRNA maturation factor